MVVRYLDGVRSQPISVWMRMHQIDSDSVHPIINASAFCIVLRNQLPGFDFSRVHLSGPIHDVLMSTPDSQTPSEDDKNSLFVG